MSLRRISAAALCLLLTSMCLSACMAAAKPVTLEIGTNDASTTNVAREMQYFASLVAKASGGSITIAPRFRVGGENAPHWDQRVAQEVIDGRLPLGMVPSRAWDALGVTSLRALSAPFVVTSDQALIGATAGPIQDPMLAGLAAAGIRGIDLFPESLRHPNGLATPLRGVDDYRGAVVRAPYSETESAMLKSFGATVVDGDIDSDVQQGLQTSYVKAAGPVMTSNVTFFGKYDVLVVNAKAWAGLSEDQQRVITDASRAAKGWVIDHLQTDAALAQQFCSRGGQLVTADATQLAGLHAAVRPLLASLRNDPVTANAIDRLLALAPAHPDVPVSCSDSAPSTVSIDGTYEYTVTLEALRSAGVTDPIQLKEEPATFRWRFSGRSWRYDAIGNADKSQPTRSGIFSVKGSRLTIYFSAQAQDNVSADVHVQQDGSLRFTNVLDSDPQFQTVTAVGYGQVWKKIK